MISAALVPPNPKLFDIAASTRCSRGVVGDVVEIAVGVGRVVVRGRRQHAARERERGDRGLDPAGRAQRVAGHRLGRRNREPLRVIAEHRLDRDGLVLVVELGRRAVRVDVADRRRLEPGVPQRGAEAGLGAAVVGRRRRDVVGVAVGGVADQLGVDPRAAPSGVLELLEHQDAGALADHEAVAVEVERPARALGLGVAGRHRPHRVEPADPEDRDRGLGAAGDHAVGVAVADRAHRLADRVRARSSTPRRATCSGRSRRSGSRSCPGASLMMMSVTKYGENPWRGPLAAWAAKVSSMVWTPPRPAPMNDPQRSASASGNRGRQPGVGDRHHAGGDAELEEPVDVLDLALVEEPRRLPALDLAGELGRELAAIEQRDRPRAALARQQARPRGFEVVADRGDEADAGDDDATPGFHGYPLPHVVGSVLAPAWLRPGSGLAPAWLRPGSGLAPAWLRPGSG